MWKEETSKRRTTNIHEVIACLRRWRDENYSSQEAAKHNSKNKTYREESGCVNRPRIACQFQTPCCVLYSFLRSKASRKLANAPNHRYKDTLAKRLGKLNLFQRLYIPTLNKFC